MSPITEMHAAMDDTHPGAADTGLDAFPAPWSHDGKGWIKDANGVVIVDVFFRAHPRHRAQLSALLLAVPDMLAELSDLLEYVKAGRQSLFETVVNGDGQIADEDDRAFVEEEDARIQRIQALINRAKGLAPQ